MIKQKMFAWLVSRMSLPAREKAFRMLGHKLGVKSFTCDGAFGLFEGSIIDEGVHGSYLRSGTWDPALQTLLRERIFGPSSGGTYVDIGANIGLTVIPAAAIAGVDCFAFEPDPMNYLHLRKNLAA